MTFTNTKSVGIDIYYYFRSQAYTQVYNQVIWKVWNQVDEVDWKVQGQIKPIKTKIEQEINK